MKIGEIEFALEIDAIKFVIKKLMILVHPDHGPKSHHDHFEKQLGNKTKRL